MAVAQNRVAGPAALQRRGRGVHRVRCPRGDLGRPAVQGPGMQGEHGPQRLRQRREPAQVGQPGDDDQPARAQVPGQRGQQRGDVAPPGPAHIVWVSSINSSV